MEYPCDLTAAIKGNVLRLRIMCDFGALSSLCCYNSPFGAGKKNQYMHAFSFGGTGTSAERSWPPTKRAEFHKSENLQAWPLQQLGARGLQSGSLCFWKELGWHICRTKLARQILFELRTFSRKILRTFPDMLRSRNPAEFPPRFLQEIPAKNQENSPTSFCRRGAQGEYFSDLQNQLDSEISYSYIASNNFCGVN